MIAIRRSDERGHFDHGWLDTRHSFSFGYYHDPQHMGFRALRVINEDVVAPGQGFGMHPHRDMEIITVVLEGELAHQDSLGHGATIRPGEVQRMSAGRGIFHSEFNASREQPVHLLQIWITPDRRGVDPSYEQKPFPAETRRGRLVLLASPDGADGSVRIHQDARVYAASPDGAPIRHALASGRHAWIQVARGRGSVNGHQVRAGDGVAISEEPHIDLAAQENGTEYLLFDLP